MIVRKQPDKKQKEALRLPRTSAVVALFAFSSRMDRDSMRLFARTQGDEVRAAAIASTGQEVLELLHGGLRPQVLCARRPADQAVRDAGLAGDQHDAAGPGAGSPCAGARAGETAARKALGLFAQYRIMLRPYGMKNLFDEIYRMGTTDDEHRLYHLRRCCEDVLDDFGAQSTLNGYRYAERMLLYALYAERPQKIGDLQQYVASEEKHRDRHCDLGAEPDVGRYVQARCGAVPRTLPALRPPGKRRALQRAAV